MFHIRQPKTETEFRQYYHLRWKLLRAPWQQPEGSEVDDLEQHCFHLMVTNSENAVIAVARLQSNSAAEAQIRYMAVDEPYRGQGIGRQLITALEHQSIKSDHGRIVLDARDTALEFYKKQGYEVSEKSYLLFDVIQHYRMKKNLYDK